MDSTLQLSLPEVLRFSVINFDMFEEVSQICLDLDLSRRPVSIEVSLLPVRQTERELARQIDGCKDEWMQA